MIAAFVKSPGAVNDYAMVWKLNGGDTIASSTWIIPTGITKDSDTSTPGTTTLRLSGGTDGVIYKCINRIVTASGLVEYKTVYIICQGT